MAAFFQEDPDEEVREKLMHDGGTSQCRLHDKISRICWDATEWGTSWLTQGKVDIRMMHWEVWSDVSDARGITMKTSIRALKAGNKFRAINQCLLTEVTSQMAPYQEDRKGKLRDLSKFRGPQSSALNELDATQVYIKWIHSERLDIHRAEWRKVLRNDEVS